MYDFTAGLKDSLKLVIDESEPLGPLDIADIEDVEVQKALFESQNKIYEFVIKHPSIIVGRRGAGKTTFLKSLIHEKEKNSVIVEITGSKAFERIVDTLQKNNGGTHVFAESASELWDWIFWTSLLSKIIAELPDEAEAVTKRDKFKKFWHGEKLSKFLAILSNSKSESVSLLSKVLTSSTNYSPENLERIKSIVRQILKDADVEAYVLLDSLEEYRLETDRMGLAISGLLRASGRFNQLRRFPEIRVCIPAEMYHKFRSFSSNSIKDFRSQLVLHWHAGELLSLIAHRYRLFLNLYPESIPLEMLTTLNNLDIYSRNGAVKFWSLLLPNHITNSVGIREDPIAYLLRHTHLLPRQMIFFLNAIMRLNKRNGGTSDTILESAIVGGVTSAEKHIWLEVCNAYKGVYPEAENIVKAAVNELPLVFSDGDLHRIYNSHAKKFLPDPLQDFHFFKRMMIEIGCIGAVIQETDRYVIGVFEYTEGEELSVSSKTKLCLHPLFCGGEKTHNLNGISKVIYPYGSDPEGLDRRDL